MCTFLVSIISKHYIYSKHYIKINKTYFAYFKWKINSTACNPNQKWNSKRCQSKCKNANKCTCENSKYLKSLVHNSQILCD